MDERWLLSVLIVAVDGAEVVNEPDGMRPDLFLQARRHRPTVRHAPNLATYNNSITNWPAAWMCGPHWMSHDSLSPFGRCSGR